MRVKRWVYVTAVTLVWLVPVAGVQIVFPEFRAGIAEVFVVTLSWQVVALLTYPAGVLGLLAAVPALFFGIVTPIESLLIAGPISLAAGYLQWFVVIPRFFDRTRRPPSTQKSSADDAASLEAL